MNRRKFTFKKFSPVLFAAVFMASVQGAFATVNVQTTVVEITTSFLSVDIDQDGLWDLKLKNYGSNKFTVQLAYRDASNFTSLKFVSAQDPTPISFPMDADMSSVGIWGYNSTLAEFDCQHSDYEADNKSLGVKINKNGKAYCA